MTDTVVLVLTDHKDCGFAIPVAGYVTSNFGKRNHTRYHYGIDLKLDRGDTVVSAFDGVVRISEWSASYGNCIVIRHYNGLETLYGHLNYRKVTCGQYVKAGELIGYGGSTGRSTGPHLHFETRYLGQPIDPNTVINFDDTTKHELRSDTLKLTSDNFEYISEFKAQEARYLAHHHRHGRHGRHYAYNSGVSKSGHHGYTVRRGDTISKIAMRNGTSVNRICQINRISRNSKLKPGKKLKVK
jgi:murein DD-endopeptidase MepM/ murein hydrolase activator NlpD